MVTPVIVIAFAVPTALSANVPAMPLVEMLTTSFVSTPTSDAEFVLSRVVALVVESYTRLLVVIPVTVRFFAVMFAVVEGCVSV